MPVPKHRLGRGSRLSLGLPPARLFLLPLSALLVMSCSDGDSGVDPLDPIDPDPAAPEAPSFTVEVPKNGAVEAEVRVENPDGLALSYEVVSGPEHGELEVWEPGEDHVFLRYTPASGFDGTDAVSYRVAAGEISDEGVVTLDVRNTAPVVEGSLVRRPSDGGVAVQFTATDADGDPLEFRMGETPGNGTLSGWTVVSGAAAADVSAETSHAGAANTSGTSATGTAFHPEAATYTVELHYEPDVGFPGPDWFTVLAFDGTTDSEPATVEVEVNQPPEIPAMDTGGPLELEGRRGHEVEVEVLVVSPLGADLTLALTGEPAHGAVTEFTVAEVAAAGTAGGAAAGAPSAPNSTPGAGQPRTFSATTTYSPNPGFAGKDSFGFSVSDGLDTVQGEVEVSVVNTPPTAEGTATTTPRNTPVEVTLRGQDPDGHPLTFEIVSGPSHGTLGSVSVEGTHPAGDGSGSTSDGSGSTAAITTATVSYTPGSVPERTASFTYRVHDGVDHSTPVEVVVTLENTAPTALSQEATLGRNGSATLTLQGDDPDGDGLTFLVLAGPQHGSLGPLTYTTVEPLPGGGARTSATVVYTPDADFAGDDRLVFAAHDGLDRSGPGELIVTVTNQAPVAVAPGPMTTPFETPVTVTLTGTDADGDDLLFLLPEPGEPGEPAHGTLSGLTPTGPTSATVFYTPDAGFSGDDSFTFMVSDGLVGSDSEATVSLTVEADPNQPPVAHGLTGADAVAAAKNSPVVIALSGSDPDGDPLTFTINNGPDHGAITGGPTSTGPTSATVEYTPTAGFDGADEFHFTVSDGTLTANATVEIVVTNQPPVALDPGTITTSMNTPVDVVLDGSDPDGDALTLEIVTPPDHGTLAGSWPAGTTTATYSYAPNSGYAGNDEFTFRFNDGTDPSNAITVQIVQDNPVLTRSPTGTLTLHAGTGVAQTVTVTNNSTTTVAQTLGITAPVGTAVTVANDSCTGANLAPLATCTFDLMPGAGLEGSALFSVAPVNGPLLSVDVEVVAPPALFWTVWRGPGGDVAREHGAVPGHPRPLDVDDLSGAELVGTIEEGAGPGEWVVRIERAPGVGGTLSVSVEAIVPTSGDDPFGPSILAFGYDERDGGDAPGTFESQAGPGGTVAEPALDLAVESGGGNVTAVASLFNGGPGARSDVWRGQAWFGTGILEAGAGFPLTLPQPLSLTAVGNGAATAEVVTADGQAVRVETDALAAQLEVAADPSANEVTYTASAPLGLLTVDALGGRTVRAAFHDAPAQATARFGHPTAAEVTASAPMGQLRMAASQAGDPLPARSLPGSADPVLDDLIHYDQDAGVLTAALRMTGIDELSLTLDPFALELAQDGAASRVVDIDGRSDAGGDVVELTARLDRPQTSTSVTMEAAPGSPVNLVFDNSHNLARFELSATGLGGTQSLDWALDNVSRRMSLCLDPEGGACQRPNPHGVSRYDTPETTASSFDFDDFGTHGSGTGSAFRTTLNANLELAPGGLLEFTNVRFRNVSFDFANRNNNHHDPACGTIPRISGFFDSRGHPFVLNSVRMSPQIDELRMGTDANPARARNRIARANGWETPFFGCRGVRKANAGALAAGGQSALTVDTNLGTVNAMMHLGWHLLQLAGGTVSNPEPW